MPKPVARPLHQDARTLAPLLGVSALLGIADGGIVLLLLLHLQSAFQLEVYQIDLVYGPGGIALTRLPRPLHRLSTALGRRAVYALACLASAACFIGLAFAVNPFIIAGWWVLASAAWAAISPWRSRSSPKSAGIVQVEG